MTDQDLRINQRVRKVSGDYSVTGVVCSVFVKRSGAVRAVVECDVPPGLLLIFSAAQLEELPAE
jgi:hypothetical protein